MICSNINFCLLVPLVSTLKAFPLHQWCTGAFHYFPVSLRYIADDPLHIAAERNKILPLLTYLSAVVCVHSILFLTVVSPTFLRQSQGRTVNTVKHV